MYEMRNNNYIISIDGNYESDANVEFYFHLMTEFYEKQGFQISKRYLNSKMEVSEIIGVLNNIKDLCNSNRNQLVYIIGSLAEPIIKDLLETQQTHTTFQRYEEVSRIYRQLSQSNKSINLLLIDNKQNKDLRNGFEKIDSMTISLGFDFKKINVTDKLLLDIYREILENIQKDGLQTPKP
jgi:hypothetical protein